jgi:glycosyltransferase involved in cell wall biosynthesis
MDYQGELQKNFRRLLVSFEQVQRRVTNCPVRLVVVGAGGFRSELMSLAERLGAAGAVDFYESLPNPAVRYLQANCHGVLLASTFEGMSMFALESLASGAPLLVARSGGLSELVDHGENGLLFNPFDPSDMADQAVRFIVEMAPRLESVRAAAKAKYERCFDPETTVGRFVRSLNTLQVMRG